MTIALLAIAVVGCTDDGGTTGELTCPDHSIRSMDHLGRVSPTPGDAFRSALAVDPTLPDDGWASERVGPGEQRWTHRDGDRITAHLTITERDGGWMANTLMACTD